MFDRTFSSVFVNNNGNVTASARLSEFTPFDFRETGDPIIAPFFADVDTNGDGSGLVNYALIAPGSFTGGGLLDGNASTSLAGHSTPGQPLGRYVFQLRQGAPTGARLTGFVTTPDDDPAPGALVQACRTGGACVSRTAGTDGRYTVSNLPAGDYTVTAFPGPETSYASATPTGVALSGTETFTQDIQLGPLPDPPPDGTTITSIGTMFRSASASGPFFPVPDGSAVMSPSNRANPSFSDVDGRFGWDVVAGFYVVTAAKDGCVSAADPSQAEARTAVMTIPPPVTDLDLRLDCPPPPDDTGGGGGGTTAPPAVTPSSTPPASTPAPRKLAGVGKVVLKGKRLVVGVSCAKAAKTACAGAVTARLGRKLIARRGYKGLKPGATSRLQLPLSKAGRKLVAKVKRGKKIKIAVTVTVRDAAGKGATAKRTVSVRR